MSDALDKKLQTAINRLTDKQKKAVLGIVNVFVEDTSSDHWNNKDFVAEMNDRSHEYATGNAQLISLDEVEKKAARATEKLKLKRAS